MLNLKKALKANYSSVKSVNRQNASVEEILRGGLAVKMIQDKEHC